MTTLVEIDENGKVTYKTEPMCIRDQFAATALPKALDQTVNYKDAANVAYLIADQMMIRRNKGSE